MLDPFCHTGSIAVAVPALTAFRFMADGIKQGEWAFGSWERKRRDDGIFVGTSLVDGKSTYVRIHADETKLLVDYDVGLAPDALAPRNSARIIPGSVLGMPENHCVVTLMTWRHSKAEEQRWLQTCAMHEAEMFVIKGLLERGK